MPDPTRFTAAFTSVLMILTAWSAQAQESYRYRNPIIFQRAHLDAGTGAQVIAGKLWLMEEDGTQLRQLTFGDVTTSTLLSTRTRSTYSTRSFR